MARLVDIECRVGDRYYMATKCELLVRLGSGYSRIKTVGRMDYQTGLGGNIVMVDADNRTIRGIIVELEHADN